MIHVVNMHDGIEIHKALASEVRIAILEYIIENDSANLNEIAKSLQITNGALTGHIKKLEDAGLITLCKNESRSNTKNYRIQYDRILTEVRPDQHSHNVYEAEFKPGLYTDFKVYPTCGLATAESVIGDYDDPRYFYDPSHASAEMIWFAKGYVEYILPAILPDNQKIDQISISAELSSEAPGCQEFYPSDIYFSLNGVELGSWTSPGDFGNIRGRYTPDWWAITSNQYGLLKTLVINHEGTFIDSIPISKVIIDQFHLEEYPTLRFRFSVPDNAEHIGGLTIYGKNFGNFDQDIKVQINYHPLA